MNSEVEEIVAALGLEPHPEGGYYREVYRAGTSVEHPGIPEGFERQRRAGSLIYYLLGPSDFSAFHRVRWSDEVWHLYAGGPLTLHVVDEDGRYTANTLSQNFTFGNPVCVVPAGHWQAAEPTGGASFVLGGCTVSPGFDFADFEMPGRADLIDRFPQHRKLIERLTRS